jgi:hypothetical protein
LPSSFLFVAGQVMKYGRTSKKKASEADTQKSTLVARLAPRAAQAPLAPVACRLKCVKYRPAPKHATVTPVK